MVSDTGLAVETTSLTKTYDDITVVDALDLAVPRNSIFGFLGPNGAGKTTTMKMLLGLIRPTDGRGTVFGLDIEQDSTQVRNRIGYLPQEPRFYSHMTARETLRFAAGFFFAGPVDGIEARIDEMLELVGMDERADRPVKTLSGGEIQRLGIAQAQIHAPDLLILDEPAAALDPLGRRDVLEILGRLSETSTVFYSTHILDDVQRVSDMVCILDHGRIVKQGPIDAVRTNGEEGLFVVEVEGDAEAARARVLTEFWADRVTLERDASGTDQLHVVANDPRAAEERLQRVLLEDPGLVVKGFARRSSSLEDAFVALVDEGGSPHD